MLTALLWGIKRDDNLFIGGWTQNDLTTLGRLGIETIAEQVFANLPVHRIYASDLRQATGILASKFELPLPGLSGMGVSARAKVGVTTQKAEAKFKLGPFGLGLSIGWRYILETQFRLKGNSEGFVLQAKSLLNDNWVEQFGIEQEQGGYRLKLENDDILVLKRYDYLSKKERIVAKSVNQDIIFYEKKQCDRLWEPAYWKDFFLDHQNEYTMDRVGCGTKGDILPVLKNGQPIAVFAVGNLSVAGKRQFSLYTEHSEEVDILLLFYIINYIRGLDFLDIDSLTVNYRVFYQFSGRSALTREHLNMLPESRRPSTGEGILWISLAALLVVVSGLISLKYVILGSGSLIAFYVYNAIKNWIEKMREHD